jgi:hypothetical protein
MSWETLQQLYFFNKPRLSSTLIEDIKGSFGNGSIMKRIKEASQEAKEPPSKVTKDSKTSAEQPKKREDKAEKKKHARTESSKHQIKEKVNESHAAPTKISKPEKKSSLHSEANEKETNA